MTDKEIFDYLKERIRQYEVEEKIESILFISFGFIIVITGVVIIIKHNI